MSVSVSLSVNVSVCVAEWSEGNDIVGMQKASQFPFISDRYSIYASATRWHRFTSGQG